MVAHRWLGLADGGGGVRRGPVDRGALGLLSLQDAAAPRIDPLIGPIAVACAIYGIGAGIFLPGPRRGHWKGGVSQPRRGLPDTRATPARFSPPVQKVFDERLATLTLPRITVSAIRLPKRSGDVTEANLLVIAPATKPIRR